MSKEERKNQALNSHIDIFLRLRPAKQPAKQLETDTQDNTVNFNLPRDTAQGYVNNQREHYDFVFNGVLGAECKQDEVFQRVAEPVINSFMDGYNGTVFAYGQTGSGKTFTITGGPERYVDRGIIPRTITNVFEQVSRKSDTQFQVHISYLEIYNEVGYDLLDPSREINDLEDLPRVTFLEDEEGLVHLRNLSTHRVKDEEESLNLLFLGDTNRTISETPMNQTSSRSHCIFTVHVEARKSGEDVVRRSKLHLVDLAGSERVSKTQIDGTILKEAKFINLSLHYLEQVIIALQERSQGVNRSHVPYRNSLMTQVLKDSLGGNCKTTMIANIMSTSEQIDESISTCRFAQRVALIQNIVMVNEEVDPNLVIKRLKIEIKQLKEEIRLLKGEGEDRGPLTDSEINDLKSRVEEYVADNSDESQLVLPGQMVWINSAYQTFKKMLKDGYGVGVALEGFNGMTPQDIIQQVRKLKLQVQQRDTEINILVAALKRRDSDKQQNNPLAEVSVPVSQQSVGNCTENSSSLDPQILMDRTKAFEVFRRSYKKNEALEENKALLKTKIDEAKAIGKLLEASKKKIEQAKNSIKHIRIKRTMDTGVAEPEVSDPEENGLKQLIEQEKPSYQHHYHELKQLKVEIEHLQMLLKQSRATLQKDFETWLAMMIAQQSSETLVSASSLTQLKLLEAPAKAASNSLPQNRPQSARKFQQNEIQARPLVPKLAWGDENSSQASNSSNQIQTNLSTKSQLGDSQLTGVTEVDQQIKRFYNAQSQLLNQNTKVV